MPLAGLQDVVPFVVYAPVSATRVNLVIAVNRGTDSAVGVGRHTIIRLVDDDSCAIHLRGIGLIIFQGKTDSRPRRTAASGEFHGS